MVNVILYPSYLYPGLLCEERLDCDLICLTFQLFGTALLVSCIFAILDKNNNSTDQGVVPLMIGLAVFVIASTFGFNCGCAINPARDLGPRLFIAMAGWGSEVFT